MRIILFVFLLLSYISVVESAPRKHATTRAIPNKTLEAVIAGSHRSAENKARDQYRHPLETLNFFEVKEDMTVVEVWPGAGGWYTEILAPYLKDKGKLYVAHFAADAMPFFSDSLKKYTEKLHKQPDIYGKVVLTVLQPPEYLVLAPDNVADRVLTFRNVHNWMANGQAEKVFAAMYKALKPGGILGVVEHRAKEGSVQDPQAKSGYVTEEYVINLAKQAGFQFVEKSEINANPKDTKDYVQGVWTLPPTLRLENVNKEKYLAIGESDRMTLKFIKP